MGQAGILPSPGRVSSLAMVIGTGPSPGDAGGSVPATVVGAVGGGVVGVRVVFGLLVPLVAAFMTWRTARIRSLDSATGLLYIVAALVLTGEIVARSLFFLTGVAT